MMATGISALVRCLATAQLVLRPTVIGERKLSRHEAAAAIKLARDVAGLLDYPMDDVWWALCNVPVNMASLLDTPQGWSVLAAYLAGDLGMGTVDYLPSVH
jgi:hypothetical protein